MGGVRGGGVRRAADAGEGTGLGEVERGSLLFRGGVRICHRVAFTSNGRVSYLEEVGPPHGSS